MKVYEINGYLIASENTNEAFGHYMEETDNLDDVFLDELNESEEVQVSIKIKRLTTKEIQLKNIICCENEDGCIFCEKKEDYVYISLQDLIENQDKFPFVLAKED